MFDPWMHCWQQGKNLGPVPDSLLSLSGSRYLLFTAMKENGSFQVPSSVYCPSHLPNTSCWEELGSMAPVTFVETCGEKWEKRRSPSLQCPVHSFKFSSEAEFFLANGLTSPGECMLWGPGGTSVVLQRTCKAQSIGVDPGDEERALGSRGWVQSQWLAPGVSSGGLVGTAVSVLSPWGAGPAARGRAWHQVGNRSGFGDTRWVFAPASFACLDLRLFQTAFHLFWGSNQRLPAMEGLKKAENWLKKIFLRWQQWAQKEDRALKKSGKKFEGFQFWVTWRMQVEERGWRVHAQSQNVLRWEGLPGHCSKDWGKMEGYLGALLWGLLSGRHCMKGFLARVFSGGVFLTVSKRMLLIRTIWSRQMPSKLGGWGRGAFSLSFPPPLTLLSTDIMCYGGTWCFAVSEDRLH